MKLNSKFKYIMLASSLALSTAQANNLFDSFVDLGSRIKTSTSVKADSLLGSFCVIDDLDVKTKTPTKTIAGFTNAQVTNYAYAAKMAYEGERSKGKVTPGTDMIAPDAVRHTFFGNVEMDGGVFIENKDGTATLSYRGSCNNDNWRKNVDMECVTDEKTGGRYHRGFLAGYKQTEAEVLKLINDFAKRKGLTLKQALNHITITGHSRGGAEATIAADQFRRKTGATPALVTYGAPRALYKKTAYDFTKAGHKAVTVAQTTDPVQYSNPAAFTGVAHVGERLALPQDKNQYPHMMNGYINALAGMEHRPTKGIVVNRGKLNEKKFDFVAKKQPAWKKKFQQASDNSAQGWGAWALNGLKKMGSYLNPWSWGKARA